MTTLAPEARPSHLAQWSAIVVTLVITAALAFALPRIADSSVPKDTELVAGERVAAGGVSIEPAEGWALTAGTDLLVISKQDSKLLFFPPAEGGGTAADAVAESAKAYTDDKTLHATLGDVNTFTTDSGLDAASATVAADDSVTLLVSFSDGTMLTSGLLSISPATYADLNEEIDSMLTTVAFDEGSAS